MTPSTKRWWRAYAVGAGLALLALTGITKLIADLADAERRALAESARQETARLALWRMDAWLSAYLAVESARPPEDYGPRTPEESSRA